MRTDMRGKILGKDGKPILLNEREQRVADINQRHVNALGYDVDITTLTTIMKKITEQSFFEIAPADYLPINVGEGAWSQQLLTYISYSLGQDFGTGIVNVGNNNSRLAAADSGVSAVPVAVKNWAKSIGWSIMDLEMAAKAGNWDLVSSKEKSRKTNWDLGIQRVAFLGLDGDSSVLGLYTQPDVTVNSTLIAQPINTLSPTDLKAFCQGVLAAYRLNCSRTAWPTHFVIPEDDYLGLAAPSSADFPIQSVLEQLEKTFKIMTKNANFKILPCAYGNGGDEGDGTDYFKYALYNYKEESLRMDIPVDYTNTLANSIDNFSFQNVGYGQFTGAKAYKAPEMLYFTCPRPS